MPEFAVTIESKGTTKTVVVFTEDADAAYYVVDAMGLINPPCLVSVEPHPPTDEADDEAEDDE